jgi:nucleotide-binding universal stress UspA family protein
MPLYRRILAPFDFSPLAEAGVRTARALAEAHAAELTILHVAQEPTFPSFYKLGALRIYGMVPDAEKLAWRALEKRFGDPAATPGVTYRVMKGEPDQRIVRFAADEGVDLIVISSHGLTGLEHVLLGSVTEKVVRHAGCDVLVVKQPVAQGESPRGRRAAKAPEPG